MIALVWIVALIGMQGEARIVEIGWEQSFQTKAACEAHAAKYEKRMPDFAHGFLNVSFDHDLRVIYRCEPKGDPA